MASSRALDRNSSSSSQVVGGFAGEADDEVGPDPGLGGQLADAVQQFQEPLPVTEPPHGPQHRAAGVLERQVEVRGDAGSTRDDLDQAGPQLGGLQVAHPHPLDAGHRGQRREDLLEQPQVAQILAVGGGVLADQEQLADALARQPFGLGQQLRRPAGHERAAEGRDRAERAAPVAAGGDLERGHHTVGQAAAHGAGTGCGRDASRQVGGDAGPRGFAVRGPVDRADRQQRAPVPRGVRGLMLAGQDVIQAAGDVPVVVEAQDLGFGQRIGQLVAVPLGQATHGRDLGPGLGRAQQLVDGLLLGRLDEATGVDHDHAGVLALGGHLPATGGQPGGQLFRIDLVTGTAQRHQADGSALRSRAGAVRSIDVWTGRHTGRLRHRNGCMDEDSRAGHGQPAAPGRVSQPRRRAGRRSRRARARSGPSARGRR